MCRRTLSLASILFGLGCAAGIMVAAQQASADEKAQADDTRLPLPDPAARQAAEKTVDDVFGSEIAAAKTSVDRSAVAKKMFDFARDEKNSSQRYVLLNRARTIAVTGGDVRLAIDAATELVAGYRIDGLRAKTATLQAIEKSPLTAVQQTQFAAVVSTILDEAIAHDETEGIAELDAMAESAARKTGNTDLQKQFAARHKRLQEIKLQADRIKPFRVKLTQDPNDADANLEVGKYYCFARHDWKTGLAMLAKGSDADLKTAAQTELIGPADSTGKLQVADQWWDISEREKEAGISREAIRQHAGNWYLEALPELKGLAQLRAQKRVADSGVHATASVASEDSPSVAPVPRSPPGSAAAQRMLLEYVSTAIKAKKTSHSAEPGFALGNQPFSLVPDAGGILVGLDVTIAANDKKITGVRPVFITAKGTINGPNVGQSDPKAIRLIAKKGYAIGALRVKGGLGIDALGVTFMRMEDDALDSKQGYDSPTLGNGDRGTQLGGDGVPVVGIFGHYDRRNVAALGLVQVGKNVGGQ